MTRAWLWTQCKGLEPNWNHDMISAYFPWWAFRIGTFTWCRSVIEVTPPLHCFCLSRKLSLFVFTSFPMYSVSSTNATTTIAVSKHESHDDCSGECPWRIVDAELTWIIFALASRSEPLWTSLVHWSRVGWLVAFESWARLIVSFKTSSWGHNP